MINYHVRLDGWAFILSLPIEINISKETNQKRVFAAQAISYI